CKRRRKYCSKLSLALTVLTFCINTTNSSWDSTAVKLSADSLVPPVANRFSSASSEGYPKLKHIKKRSSCDSGNGKVPPCSTGFCVAITKKGDGSAWLSPSTVTCISSMASSKALCVLGAARLISSASKSCVNTGPGRN